MISGSDVVMVSFLVDGFSGAGNVFVPDRAGACLCGAGRCEVVGNGVVVVKRYLSQAGVSDNLDGYLV